MGTLIHCERVVFFFLKHVILLILIGVILFADQRATCHYAGGARSNRMGRQYDTPEDQESARKPISEQDTLQKVPLPPMGPFPPSPPRPAQQKNARWFLVSCGNLFGKPSLQAVV